VERLENEVSALRSVNLELVTKVDELVKLNQAPSGSSYAVIAKGGAKAPAIKRKDPARATGRAVSENDERDASRGGHPPPTPPSPSLCPPPPDETAAKLPPPMPPTARPRLHSEDSTGFIKVSRKKTNKTARTVSRGTRSNTALSVVSKRKSLFLSRLSFATSIDDLSGYIVNELAINGVECSRLKTKVDNKYASFHLSVPEDSFEILSNVDSWPQGCILAPFWGRLRPDQLYIPPTQ